MIPRALWDSQVPEAIRQSFLEAKDRSEEDRQVEAARRRSILEDDWEDILYQELYTEYESPKLRRQLRHLISTEHNLAKRICRELSRVYKWGATRELRTPAETETFRRLADECRYDEVLAQANFYVNGLRDVGIAPRVTQRGRMKLDVFLPDSTSIAQYPDDPTEALAQWSDATLSQTRGYSLVTIAYADPEKWIFWDQRGNVLATIPHAVGKLPVTWVHADERIDTFWADTVGRDLFEANISIGKLLFKQMRQVHWMSEMQPTYKGKPREIARTMALGMDSPWVGPGDWGVLNFQGDPTQIIETIKARIGWIAEQYGLAADVYDLSASATSGFQIRLKRLPLEEARAAQIKVWRRTERELLTLLAHASQDHPYYKLPLDAEFKKLDFHEEPMLEDPLNQNRVWEERIKLGLKSKRDVFMEMNPDLTREQAGEEMDRIRAERAEEVEAERALNMPKDPSDPGKSPEENGAEGGRPPEGGGDEGEDGTED